MPQGASGALAEPARKPAQSVSIPLTKGKVSLIDREDLQRVRQFKWSATVTHRGKWYAVRKVTTDGKSTSQLLHRFLMDAPSGVDVDHENGDGLDNRRSTNLRIATRSQNTAAKLKLKADKKSIYRGVSPDRTAWRAEIGLNNARIRLGRFTDQREAARAYDRAALRHFGKFARLNFPEEHI